MRILGVACAIVFISGCAVKKENPVDTLAADTMNVEAVTSSGSTGSAVPGRPATSQAQKPNTAPPSSSTPRTSTPDMVVTEYGIGPIRAGMTVAQLAKAMGSVYTVGDKADASSPGPNACTYIGVPKAPSGVAVMIEHGKVARIEVRRGTIATSTGAKIGDTEAKINSLYAGRVVTTAHKYTPDGHYLTVTPTDKSANRIVFETDGNKVTEYRSGALPAVEYVERCG